MKRVLLAIGVLVTVCNLMAGVSYSALCQSSGGSRACGTTCTVGGNGQCACTGTCTADEMKWVEGAGKGGEDLLE
jgi:hypothetical protein